MDDTDNVASERLMTWAGDKNPNDFIDWSVDSEGNVFIDIPIKSTELQLSNDNHDINQVISIPIHRNVAYHIISVIGKYVYVIFKLLIGHISRRFC